MKNFVKLIQQVHEERYMKVLKKIVTEKMPVVLLSTLKIPDAIGTVKEFREQGLNIILLITTDKPVDETDFEVVTLSNAVKIYPQPEYILTNNGFEIDARVALKNFPASKVLSINRGNTEQAYEIFMTHLDELQEVYASLIDEESKKTFCGYWLGNITNQLGKIAFANTPHYMCAGFIPERGAIAIDGGLCDGGTAARFSQMGYKVYGFEMDKTNYLTAVKVGEVNNFVVENLGLGAYDHKMTYSHMLNPGASRLDPNGSEITQIITIDGYVREKNLPRVDFIKLDVEGAELDVLKGAATTIARFKPILALSAYHKWDDFWTLMNFVKSIRPDYEFAMRQFVISKEDGAYHFNNNLEKNLYNLGLHPALAIYQECVLFAR
ncbi:MAG: FkbM family methyltransferase [Selenomonadaceae bacterium]|nr:FkbM family methyltransferase [Selenomonadaceae bacterium]